MEKGRPIFNDNIDEVLADKIMGNTEKNTEQAPKQKHGPKEAFSTSNKKYDGQAYLFKNYNKQNWKSFMFYGIAALVCLVVLAGLTYMIVRSRKDK
jgi:hypothetical protein